MIENWRWRNDTSTAKSSFVSGPLFPERPGDEAKQSPVGLPMCGAHLFIAALCVQQETGATEHQGPLPCEKKQ